MVVCCGAVCFVRSLSHALTLVLDAPHDSLEGGAQATTTMDRIFLANDPDATTDVILHHVVHRTPELLHPAIGFPVNLGGQNGKIFKIDTSSPNNPTFGFLNNNETGVAGRELQWTKGIPLRHLQFDEAVKSAVARIFLLPMEQQSLKFKRLGAPHVEELCNALLNRAFPPAAVDQFVVGEDGEFLRPTIPVPWVVQDVVHKHLAQPPTFKVELRKGRAKPFWRPMHIALEKISPGGQVPLADLDLE